jgi:hypothetical protein
MARPRTNRTPAVGSVETPRRQNAPSADDVARRAYELYESRGSEPGRDLDDWLQAERELSAMPAAAVSERPAAKMSTDEAAATDTPPRPSASEPESEQLTSL